MGSTSARWLPHSQRMNCCSCHQSHCSIDCITKIRCACSTHATCTFNAAAHCSAAAMRWLRLRHTNSRKFSQKGAISRLTASFVTSSTGLSATSCKIYCSPAPTPRSTEARRRSPNFYIMRFAYTGDSDIIAPPERPLEVPPPSAAGRCKQQENRTRHDP